MERVYMAPPDSRWGRLLVKLAVLGGAVYYFGIFLLIAVAGALMIAWLISKILPRGLITVVAADLISFMLIRRFAGPVATVPVRDMRLRDAAGQDSLVRLKGQLTSGNVTVGDDVLVEGWDRNGMLLFRRGHNKAIRADIKVRQ